MTTLYFAGIAATMLGILALTLGQHKQRHHVHHEPQPIATDPEKALAESIERLDRLVARMLASESLNRIHTTAALVAELASQQRELMHTVHQLAQTQKRNLSRRPMFHKVHMEHGAETNPPLGAN